MIFGKIFNKHKWKILKIMSLEINKLLKNYFPCNCKFGIEIN